jgi:hypothetical protein
LDRLSFDSEKGRSAVKPSLALVEPGQENRPIEERPHAVVDLFECQVSPCNVWLRNRRSSFQRICPEWSTFRVIRCPGYSIGGRVSGYGRGDGV